MLAITPETRRILGAMSHAQMLREERAERKRAEKRAARIRSMHKDRVEIMTVRVAAILRKGRPTYFAFEASCRHALRQALCLKRWPWRDADDTASFIVAAALHRIGAVRPTHWQGQPEHVSRADERLVCGRNGCGRPIHIEEGMQAWQRSFCCEECRDAARQRRAERVSWDEYLAQCEVRKELTLTERTRPCQQCGEPFSDRDLEKKFCSPDCYHEAQLVHEDVPCPECGEPFKPSGIGQGKFRKFCSARCATKNRVRNLITRPKTARTCLGCGGIFYALGNAAKYCIPEHRPTARIRCDEVPPLAPDDIPPEED